MVEVRSIPRTAAATTAFTAVEDVVGTRARFGIGNGEQLTPPRLVETAPVSALSFQIPEGLRGFSMPMETDSSPSAVLVPGDFVDVLLTIDIQLIPVLVPEVDPDTLLATGDTAVGLAEEGEQVVATLYQNLQVLSVEAAFVTSGEEYEASTRGARPEGGGAGFVIMAVTPEQAQILTLARQLGTLSFTLRPFGDEEFVPLEPFLEPFLIPLTPPAPEAVSE
jgi:pilus assembly protein CpaB